jgi:DNA-damage-inducible protein J
MLYNMAARKELIFMAQVNFRVDDTVKARAEDACAAMGLTMSSAINIFLTKVANERRIPFEVSADPFYSDEHIAMLERRAADMRQGKNVHEHELIEV